MLKRKFRKREKGSFTVEASILIPFLLFVLVIPISNGIRMYQEVRDRGENRQLWLVKEFYTAQGIREVTEDGP